ncbi:MAG: tail fiber domain-containing protein, partial [Bacteroidales bacterium]|nr:tail fiber domain-containing protein [Bacteroidales bacterium]
QTTNNKQQTTNNKQQTTNNKQQTTNNKQQTTNNKQQTTNNKQQTTITNTMNRKKTLILIFVIGIFSSGSISQNIAITDDDGYTAETSAMLDVKSLTKGMLIPRVALISLDIPIGGTKPEGLLIWNTSTTGTYDTPGFYYWNGSAWVNLLAKSDYSGGIDAALFSVVNATGDTIFAVYPEGVRIWVDDGPSKATGSKGGFAVGGLNAGKGYTNEYFRITPDSIRMYIDTAQSTKATGSKGGFAVGGLNAGKTNGLELLRVTDDSVRIYVKNTPSKATGSKGGFAVGGFNAGKTIPVDFLQLTPQNYFIGHESGSNITTGLYNQFMGYQAGKSNSTGSSNVFIGNQSGINNLYGRQNVFIGYYSGLNNLGDPGNIHFGAYNSFIGSESGFSNTTGSYNVCLGYLSGYTNDIGMRNIFIGSQSGMSNTDGNDNVFIGQNAAHNNNSGINNVVIGANAGFQVSGDDNVIIGKDAGYKNTGNSNILIGQSAGFNETGSNKLYIENSTNPFTFALIYGEFDNNILRFNADVGIGTSPSSKLDVNGNITLHEDNWFGISSTTERIVFDGSNDEIEIMGAKVGIGTTSPIGKLDVQGDEVRIWDGTATINYATGTGDLYVEDVLEVDDDIYVTDNVFVANYVSALGGIHVGGISDPGTDNLIVDGNIGIGISNPENKFHLFQSSGNTTLEIESNSGAPKIILDGTDAGGTYTMAFHESGGFKASLGWSSNNDYFFLYETINSLVSRGGYIGINTTTPGTTYRLYVNGSVSASSYNTHSDLRLKKDISPINNALDKVKLLNGVNFNWRKEEFPDMEFSKEHQIGFVAQEVKEILPEVVTQNDNGYFGISYGKVVPVLVEAIKEQQKMIEELKVKNSKKDTEIQGLKIEVEKIESLQKQINKLNELMNVKASK